MALRRLFSGWLIAMAALARSVARALERASEERSSPALGSASDPVMAALAERYPGAPAHWLAHVAERTSQLAETGQAPLSLNSDPATWPTLRPDAAPSAREALEDRPAAIASRRSAPSPRAPEVPSLAALRDRPSEVWRRPDPEPRRRPRPVFAPVASERSTRLAATIAAVAPPRRPRSPLTFSAHAEAPDRAVPTAPRSTTPTSDAAATASPRQTWSEAPAPRAAAEHAPRADDPPVPKAALEHRFAPASPRASDPSPFGAASDQTPPAPSARRQRSWFFAKTSAGRLGRALDLSVYPEHGARKAEAEAREVVAGPARREAFVYGRSDHRAGSPERTWRALTSPHARPSILQALAAIGVRPHPAVAPERTSEPAVDRPAQEPDRVGSPESRSAPRPRPSFPAAGAFATSEGVAPSRSIEEAGEVAAPRGRQLESRRLPTGEGPARDRRPSFAGERSIRPRPGSPRFVDAPSDDRWPGLPPPTLTPPVGVEAPAPRWDQLAREQEEGRWSV